MDDITKCKGVGCLIKDKCYRYTTERSEFQSFLLKEPYEIKENVFTCDLFWGDKQKYIFNKIKQILDGK